MKPRYGGPGAQDHIVHPDHGRDSADSKRKIKPDKRTAFYSILRRGAFLEEP